MHRMFTFFLFVASFVAAQEGNPPKPEPCVAAGETIYQPGIDHVEPPELIPQKKKGSALGPSRTQVTLQVLLNSQGIVCDVRISRTTDAEAAKTIANDVAQNFKFKPATRYKKPVAVKMTMNFDLHK